MLRTARTSIFLLCKVEFCIALEAEFKTEIPDYEWERILTVGDAVDAVAGIIFFTHLSSRLTQKAYKNVCLFVFR